jgi:hypothetical protein
MFGWLLAFFRPVEVAIDSDDHIIGEITIFFPPFYLSERVGYCLWESHAALVNTLSSCFK